MDMTGETVERMARLSRLKLSGEETARMAGELARILDYMEVLGELDAGEGEPASGALPLKNVLRADEAEPSLDRADLLRCAPETDGVSFLAPKTVE